VAFDLLLRLDQSRHATRPMYAEGSLG
jgi:hypothetical protein